ncbi:uncharacterized protein LOC120390402 isoform X2 [Mauremys reevesii]|uniref:uncharacterized protein LOC120390402 isoform X1 n=1 Tax=Mauremys reevesii TaxID=260615 RepID=UPI00193F3162|nr:uncharacterized protein LOC120390402 isoform X1 [Mauremys reevesii]XP_039368981.1 uncharacterized protein LOC120390402 isoform X2 [Mauremys reevesii]
MSLGLAEKLKFKQTTKALSCLSLLLELLVLVSPYWMEVESPGFETSMGLWNICLSLSCSKLPMGTVAFEVAKALMTLSTLLGFIAVCSVLTSFHTFRKYRLAAVTNLLTGIVMLVSVVVFGVSFTSISEPFHSEMRFRHGWCLYVGFLASFLFLLSALVSLITHIQGNKTPTQSLNQGQQGGLRPGSTARLHEDQPRPEPPPPPPV